MCEITAVVLNYRTAGKTLACLQSLAIEGVEQVVLVENSEDGGVSLAELRSGLNDLRAKGLEIHILDEGCNLGFAAGVNRALAYIKAEGVRPVLLINSDARLQQGTLAQLLGVINMGADIAAPMTESVTNGVEAPYFYYHRYLGLLTRWPLWGSIGYITGACMLLAPTVVSADLFDEDFFFYGEDVMLGFNMNRMGKVCKIVPNSVVFHEGSGSARNGSFFYEYHINRGHWLLGGKLANNKVEYGVGLCGRFLMLSLRAVIRSVRFKCLLPLRALLFSFNDISGRNKNRVKPD